MKLLLFTLICLLSFVVPGQSAKRGDNLNTVFDSFQQKYYSAAPKMTPWAEGAGILYISDQPDPATSSSVIIALRDTTLIGVLHLGDSTYFLLDGAGDSVLSVQSEVFFRPGWAVKRSSGISSSDKTILSVLYHLYRQTMQADNSELDPETLQQYQAYQTNTSLANRHIALLFDNYQTIITETAAKGRPAPGSVCIPLIRQLAGECIGLFDRIPVIVCIYMGEALLSAGMIDDARRHFRMALQLYPDSVPLQVYNYRLEEDSRTQARMLSRLKQKHPRHWMVQDL
jgi:hypothetical protein